MLQETCNLTEEIARNDVEITRLRDLAGQFNIHDTYKPVINHNYGFALYSLQKKKKKTNVPTDN